MASRTMNIGLEKPGYTEKIDVATLNRNMDTIDSKFNGINEEATLKEVIDEKLNKPLTVGLVDQILRNNGDGTTRWDNPASTTEIGEFVTDWLDDHVPTGETLAIDDSLTIQNAAAEAKAAGNMIIVSQNQPTAPTNKFWIQDQGGIEYTVPLYSEHQELKDSIGSVLGLETIYSKNLNKTPYPATYTSNGVTFTHNTDGSMSLSGTPTGNNYWPTPAADGKWLLPAGTYTLSGGRNKMVITLFLYEHKNDTTRVLEKSSGTSSVTFTTTADYWAWIRFSILSDSSPDGITLYPQLESGSQATSYQSPYEIIYKSDIIDDLSDDITELDSTITEIANAEDELAGTLSNITEIKTGKNLVDPTKRATGFLNSDGTLLTNGTNANYSTSDYIALDASSDYAFGVFSSSSGNLDTYERVICLLFDESKNIISDSYQNISTGGCLTFNSGSSAKYARVSGKTNHNFQLEKDRTTPSSYEAYNARNIISAPLGEDPITQVQEQIETSINDLGVIDYETEKNLVDPSALVTGMIDQYGVVQTASTYANYKTSDYIELELNTDYVFGGFNSTTHNLRTDQRTVCLLFDAAKGIVSNSYQNISTGGYLTFNSSTTAKYARVSTVSSSLFQVEKGRTTPSAYEEYVSHKVIALTLGETPTSQIQDQINRSIDESGIIEYETGKNLVDPSKLVQGYIKSNGSVATNDSYAYYSTSEYIALEANTNYVFECYNANGNIRTDQRAACLLFDDAKVPVTGTYQDLSTGGMLTFSSGTTCKYARVTARTADTIFQLEVGTTPTGLEEFSGKYVMNYPLGNTPFVQSQTANILYGKKWAVCGDSFTDGATDGKITDDGMYKGYRYVYPYLIGNRNNMRILRFFNGGQTLAFPAEPGTFTNSLTNPNGDRYYQNIPADVDYITIYLGINDANHASGSSQDGEDTTGVIPLGEITDSTTATYYGAWNVVLTWLITNRPNAHIGIIVTNGNSSDTYRQAQIAIAKKYGIAYIDMNGDERTPAMLRTSNPDIASAVKTALIEKWRVSSANTHPNDAAHLYESTFIENFLRSI